MKTERLMIATLPIGATPRRPNDGAWCIHLIHPGFLSY